MKNKLEKSFFYHIGQFYILMPFIVPSATYAFINCTFYFCKWCSYLPVGSCSTFFASKSAASDPLCPTCTFIQTTKSRFTLLANSFKVCFASFTNLVGIMTENFVATGYYGRYARNLSA